LKEQIEQQANRELKLVKILHESTQYINKHQRKTHNKQSLMSQEDEFEELGVALGTVIIAIYGFEECQLFDKNEQNTEKEKYKESDWEIMYLIAQKRFYPYLQPHQIEPIVDQHGKHENLHPNPLSKKESGQFFNHFCHFMHLSPPVFCF